MTLIVTGGLRLPADFVKALKDENERLAEFVAKVDLN